MSDEAVSLLAANGFDEKFGARPLRREMQRQVEDGLSEAILSGEIKQGDTVMADVQDGKIHFNVMGRDKSEGQEVRTGD